MRDGFRCRSFWVSIVRQCCCGPSERHYAAAVSAARADRTRHDCVRVHTFRSIESGYVVYAWGLMTICTVHNDNTLYHWFRNAFLCEKPEKLFNFFYSHVYFLMYENVCRSLYKCMSHTPARYTHLIHIYIYWGLTWQKNLVCDNKFIVHRIHRCKCEAIFLFICLAGILWSARVY